MDSLFVLTRSRRSETNAERVEKVFKLSWSAYRTLGRQWAKWSGRNGRIDITDHEAEAGATDIQKYTNLNFLWASCIMN